MFKVLAIDGGIMLGVIPAQVLTRIELRYQDRLGGRRLIDCFDLVAGTSTGGLIAAGLTTKTPSGESRTPQVIKDLYYDRGSEIFPPKGWFGNTVTKIPLVKHLYRLPIFRTMYSAKGINRVLRDTFGDTTLSQADPYLLVPSYESVRRAAYFFSSKDLGPDQEVDDETYDWMLRDVCRATSAGPPFLPAHFIREPAKKRYYCFGDGGTFANNPTMCAYAEAITKFKKPHDDIMILSLGTSTPNKREATDLPEDDRQMTEEELRQSYAAIPGRAFTILDMKDIVQMLLDGNADTVNYQAKQHMGERYLRINPYGSHQLTGDAFRSDRGRLNAWCDLADNAFEFQQEQLDHFMDCLISDKDPAVKGD